MASAPKSEAREQIIALDQRVRALIDNIQRISAPQTSRSVSAPPASLSSPALSAPQRNHFQLVLPSMVTPSLDSASVAHILKQHPSNTSTADDTGNSSVPAAPSNNAVPIHSLPCRPWNRNDYLQRLETYRVLTFFAHSAQLSPLQFARYGWVNNTLDCVECTFCRKQLSLKDANTIPFFYSKINEAHALWCLWRSNPCPLSFSTIHFHTRGAAFQEFERRYQSYSILDNLPDIRPHEEIDNSLFEPCFKALVDQQIVSDDEREKVISGLVILGWELSQRKTISGQASLCLSCSFCQRKLVLSSLLRNQSDHQPHPTPNAKRARVETAEKSTISGESQACQSSVATQQRSTTGVDLPSYFIKQHRWYCPWVSQEMKTLGLPSSPRPKNELDTSPGYIRFIRAINQSSSDSDLSLADKIASLQKLVFGVPLVSKRIKPKS